MISTTRSRAIKAAALLPAVLLMLGARQQTQEDSQSALQRGMKAYQQGDFTAAIESFEAVLSGQPELPWWGRR